MSDENKNNNRSTRRVIQTGVSRNDWARQDEISAAAMDLAERKIKDGTASSQLLCMFLKRTDPAEKIRMEILEKQRDLIDAKTESLRSSKRAEEALGEVVKAMKRYSGYRDDDDDLYEDYE